MNLLCRTSPQTGLHTYLKSQTDGEQILVARLAGSLINKTCARYYFRGQMSSEVSGGNGPGPNFPSRSASSVPEDHNLPLSRLLCHECASGRGRTEGHFTVPLH